MSWLVPAFFMTALLYASAGFGGGSTYTALLALAGLDHRLIAPLSLMCNVLVVTGGTVRFARAGLVPWRRAAILIALGAPAAFAGGLIALSEQTFYALLGGSLIAAGILLLRPVSGDAEGEAVRPHPLARYVPLIAVPLGLLAGMVGIGGGIFLAPLLHAVRWDRARVIAATASLFILVNSLFGLGGQLLRGTAGRLAAAVDIGLPVFVAVVIGGQIGSHLAARTLPGVVIRRLTAGLTMFAGVRLLLQV